MDNIMKQSISVKFYRAAMTGDYSEIYDTIKNDIRIINRRLAEFDKAGENDYYHVKEIRRIGERLDMITPSNRLNIKADRLATLEKNELQELVYELESFRTSRTGTVKKLIRSDEKRLETLFNRHEKLSKWRDTLTREQWKDFVNNETIQRALSKQTGFSSTQLIDDYARMLDDEDLDFSTFERRLQSFLDTKNEYASYFDYMRGDYDNDLK